MTSMTMTSMSSSLLTSAVEELQMLETATSSPVAAFYKDKSVFITGATGFMGKVLLEKLLRTTAVKKVYLLIRPKRGVATKDRLKQLLASPVFRQLQEQGKAELEQRVECVSGDMTSPGLGLSEEEERLLVEEVNVIFHSAATLRFDEALNEAVNMNVVGVQKIVRLGKKVKHLAALVHVSTAYSNNTLTNVPEEIHDYGDPDGLITLAEVMEPELLNSLTTQLKGTFPNTYTYTKALAEAVLQKEAASLPIAIVRPSIVVSAWKEPMPGWIENLNGPTGAVSAIGKGLWRSMIGKGDIIADVIPVDTCISAMVAVAWRTATSPPGPIKVYHCTSGSTRPITWATAHACFIDAVRKYPFEGALRYPYAALRESPLAHRAAQVVLHTLPALALDLVAQATGAKPSLNRAVTMMHKSQAVLTYFTTHEYTFQSNNLGKLQAEMSQEDRKTFNLDISKLDWPEFVEDWTKGCREFIFKEKPETLPNARRQLDRLYWGETLAMVVVVLVFLRLLMVCLGY